MGIWKYAPINICDMVIDWYVCGDCGKTPALRPGDKLCFSEYCPWCGVVKTNASAGILKLTLDEFTDTYCDMCGTQRCDPKNPDCLHSCGHYKTFNPIIVDNKTT